MLDEQQQRWIVSYTTVDGGYASEAYVRADDKRAAEMIVRKNRVADTSKPITARKDPSWKPRRNFF